MRYIRDYDSYKKYQHLNEEFIGKLIKGALGKLFQAFSAPFKDLVNDIKKSFKEDDPNSIKSIIMTNFNQAIDAAQKLIRDKNTGDPTTIIDQFITSLTELANGIGKDFTTAIADKGKASQAYNVAKSILLGKEDVGWEGIVGLLNDPNYKYSKTKYLAMLTEVTKKNPNNQAAELKAKQNAAMKFFDDFQKDIAAQLDKNLTEDEMQKIYDEAVKTGTAAAKFDFDKLEEFKNNKTKVKYKREGYDDKKVPELQPNQIGEKEITDVDKEKQLVIFTGKNNLRIEKKFSDILGPVEGQENKEPNVNQQVTTNLKELSKDPKNIEAVKKVTDAIKKDPTIITKIEEILPKEEVPAAA
jgi:hypothetical protein